MTPLEHWRLADEIMANVESAKVKRVSSITIESMVNEAKTHAVMAAAGFSLLDPGSLPANQMWDLLTSPTKEST
jgi:hypothetical protein